jgi:hypothetical protein
MSRISHLTYHLAHPYSEYPPISPVRKPWTRWGWPYSKNSIVQITYEYTIYMIQSQKYSASIHTGKFSLSHFQLPQEPGSRWLPAAARGSGLVGSTVFSDKNDFFEILDLLVLPTQLKPTVTQAYCRVESLGQNPFFRPENSSLIIHATHFSVPLAIHLLAFKKTVITLFPRIQAS